VGVTRALAKYIVNASIEDFPPEAVQAAKAGILDCIGCMLAGCHEPLAEILSGFVGETGGTPTTTVVGRGLKTSPPNAAWLNGAIGHALDYDDINRDLRGHPSVVVLPPALALGEHLGRSGRDVLLAYMVGFEVACRLGTAMSIKFSDDLGWHPTAPLGALGAGAAAAKIMGLDEERTAMALSLSASQAAGLRENFGTMTKPFHAGNSSRSGVVAAMLVTRGHTASMTGLEGRFGFLRAFSGGAGYDGDKALAGLGKPFSLVQPGIEIKKYPCCGSTHRALDALFMLLDEGRVNPAEVEAVDVEVDFDPPRSLIHYDPHTALEGKFSMQYCIAAALVDGRVGLGSFTDAQVMRPEVRALIQRIRMVRNPGYEGKPSWIEATTQVQITLKSGKVRQQRVARSYEGPLRGVTGDDLRAKFMDCASRALDERTAKLALTELERLEKLDSLRELMETLAGNGKA
jgi:2-methylcitrate dehydratase PrpD